MSEKTWRVERLIAKRETPTELAIILENTLNEFYQAGWFIVQILNHSSGGYTVIATRANPKK